MNSDDDEKHDRYMKLFLQSEPALLRYVLCLVPNVHDAREIVQSTAVALWKKFDQYDADQPFVPWALRFALIETKQFLRTRQRWQGFLDDDTIALLLTDRERMAGELDERRVHLRHCLRKLPQPHRETVEAYYFRDQNVERIAASTHRTVAAVYKILQRAREELKGCVQRQMKMAGQA